MPSWVTGVAATMVRALVALRVYDWYMRRQRFLHTVVTDMRGPSMPKAFCGAPITDMVPLAAGGGGNVAVSFAALSYAGTLSITVTADPDAVPDLSLTTALLQSELDALGLATGHGSGGVRLAESLASVAGLPLATRASGTAVFPP
jgi:hypothetical protein